MSWVYYISIRKWDRRRWDATIFVIIMYSLDSGNVYTVCWLGFKYDLSYFTLRWVNYTFEIFIECLILKSNGVKLKKGVQMENSWHIVNYWL